MTSLKAAVRRSTVGWAGQSVAVTPAYSRRLHTTASEVRVGRGSTGSAGYATSAKLMERKGFSTCSMCASVPAHAAVYVHRE